MDMLFVRGDGVILVCAYRRQDVNLGIDYGLGRSHHPREHNQDGPTYANIFFGDASGVRLSLHAFVCCILVYCHKNHELRILGMVQGKCQLYSIQ